MQPAGLNPVLLELAFNRQFDVKRAFVPNPNAAASAVTPEAQQAAAAPPPGMDPAAAGGAPPTDPAAGGAAPPPGMDPAAAGAAPPPADPAAAGAAPPPEAAAPPPPPEPAPAPAPPAGMDPEMIRNIIREEMGGGAAGAGAKGKGKPKPGDEMALRNQKLLMNLHKSLNIPLPYDILDGEDGEQGGAGGGEKKPSGGSKSAEAETGVAPSFRLGTLAQNIDATFRLHQLAAQ